MWGYNINNRRRGIGTGNYCNNNYHKEGRWAEQMLNVCATAITAGNLPRVQHLMYKLHEHASPIGDANRRLATHGIRALTQRLSSTTSPITPTTFASIEPRFFQHYLVKFNEISPWFAFPNSIANSWILQILSEEQDRPRNLHILDIGVSHGIRWPPLLEALSRRSGGPPPLIRLTVITATFENDQNTETPFSIGHNFASQLLDYAKSININLQINCLNNYPLQNLSTQIINSSPDETLIVCTQFRLHQLNHKTPDERTQFCGVLRNMEPKGVILSENDVDCSCNNCRAYVTGFSRKLEYLWKFLASSSLAFKGEESEERKMIEREAAKALTSQGEMNEGKNKWCERMREAGFVGVVLGEDAINGAEALLREYDSNWEMSVEERDGCVGLWWRGHPVSFYSLWKLSVKVKGQLITVGALCFLFPLFSVNILVSRLSFGVLTQLLTSTKPIHTNLGLSRSPQIALLMANLLV